MPGTYSNIEAQEIIASADAALEAVDGIIRERLDNAREIDALYRKLLDQSGNKLAKSIALFRTGPGKYRTVGTRKKGGTKSNLYLAATSGADATIETRCATYDAQMCYRRALAVAGIDERTDAFKDLVFMGYKQWLHEEIFDKPVSEWRALRDAIEQARTAAEPALQGGLSRLFMGAQAKQEAFAALDELQKMDVAGIARNADYWPEFSAKHLDSKQDIFENFRHDGKDRSDILGCLHAELGDFEIGGGDRRPFSSEEVQRALEQLRDAAAAPAAISDAHNAARKAIAPAIDALRESDLVAHLARHPIEELGAAKTGAQVKKLQDAGVLTLGDLYERLHAPEQGTLPGVGPKTRAAVESFLEPIVADILRGWRPRLSADSRTDAATQVVCTVQAYIELGKRRERARHALDGLAAFEGAQAAALLYATDQLDWLLADDECIRATSEAMEVARGLTGSKDGRWLLSQSRGSKAEQLATDLVPAGRAWKAFAKDPDAFYEIIGEHAPEAPATKPAAPAVEGQRPDTGRKPHRAEAALDAPGDEDGQAVPAEEGAPAEEREPTLVPARDTAMDLVVFMLTFLSRGWFFFDGDVLSDEEGIAWDGSRHTVTNLKIDFLSLQEMRQFIQEFDAGFEDESEVANYFIAFLNELEKDTELRIPRARIARGVKKALPKGPLTGITLANLCESSRGLIFRGGFDAYQVLFDTRLSRGIPRFFDLIARMLWDLRGCVKTLNGQPFDVMFLATRSLDADPYVGAVDEPVEGAQDCPVRLHVAERPDIGTPPRSAAQSSAALENLIKQSGGDGDDTFALSADGKHTLLLNDAKRAARLDGSALDLEPAEYYMLRVAMHQGNLSDRLVLGREVFGHDERYPQEKTELILSSLRLKLGDSDPANAIWLDGDSYLGSLPHRCDAMNEIAGKPDIPERVVWEPEGTLSPIDTKALGLPYELDVENWQIVVRGEPVWTHPNWFRILHKLTSAPGRAFSNEELKEGLFNKSAKAAAGPIVSHYIGDIRGLLGESGKQPHYIRNKPRVGYWLELD